MPSPDPEPRTPPPPAAAAPRNANLLEVTGAVVSSFLGIRKGTAMQRDAVSIKPHQVIAVAVALVALFVLTLIFFVRMIVRSAGL